MASALLSGAISWLVGQENNSRLRPLNDSCTYGKLWHGNRYLVSRAHNSVRNENFLYWRIWWNKWFILSRFSFRKKPKGNKSRCTTDCQDRAMNKYGFRTVSSGTIRVRFNVLIQGEDYGQLPRYAQRNFYFSQNKAKVQICFKIRRQTWTSHRIHGNAHCSHESQTISRKTQNSQKIRVTQILL